MPGFDQTGPMGAGPMTGGASGRCNPAMAGNIPAFGGGYGYGRGLGLRRGFRGGYGPGAGRGRGGGRGYGWGPPAAGPAYMPAYPMDAASEMDRLKADADMISLFHDNVVIAVNGNGSDIDLRTVASRGNHESL